MMIDTERIVSALRAGLGPSVSVLVARSESPEACPRAVVLPPGRASAVEAGGEPLLTRIVQPVRIATRSYGQADALACQAADAMAGLGYRLAAWEPDPAPPRGVTLRFEAWEAPDGLIYPAEPAG